MLRTNPDTGTVRHLQATFLRMVEHDGGARIAEGLMHDVTDIMVAREEALESEANLRKAQAVAHVGSWAWYVQEDRLEWSDEMYRIFGLDPDSFTGRLTEVMASAIHPDDVAVVEASNRAVEEQGRATPAEYRVVHADGTVRTVWAEAGALKVDDQGRPWKLTGIVQDITERKRIEDRLLLLSEGLEETIRVRTHALSEANEELESFIYSASHDLRAPLRVVDGYAAMLREWLKDSGDAEADRLAGEIREGTAQMAALIDDLLAFSHVGKRPIDAQTLSLDAMVSELTERLQQAFPERAIEFHVNALPAVSGDTRLIRQVMMNVLENAVKFTRVRETAVIRVEGGVHQGMAIIRVTDNGAGFDSRDVHKLFRVFQRLHYPDEFEGTGVGLAIVKRIVERHGGRVTISGELDQGAVVEITLPAAQQLGAKQGAPVLPPRQGIGPGRWPG